MESVQSNVDVNQSINTLNGANQVNVKMLASVSNLDEVALALSAGVDIIDLKNPNKGALGALAIDEITEIVKLVDGKCPISATIGDLSTIDEVISPIQATIETRVDIVKIGFFESMDCHALIQAVAPYTKKQKIIAVLFAESFQNFSILPLLKVAGFYGVMLDTANKNGKHLLNYLNLATLNTFVLQAKELKLEVGLAGALRESQVADLSKLQPNYLGFRSALCQQNQRTNTLNENKISLIKQLLQKCNNQAIERL